jgi:hypothetical protein
MIIMVASALPYFPPVFAEDPLAALVRGID